MSGPGGSNQATPLAQRMRARILYEREALAFEFQEWRSSAQPRAKYARHHSQIKRMTEGIESYLDLQPAMPVGRTPAGGEVVKRPLPALDTLELQDLAFKELTYSDEFAWECYLPARTAALAACPGRAETCKEPPLTYFAGELSPSMYGRDAIFLDQAITNASGWFERIKRSLQQMPVPVIALPWQQLGHLPAGITIAHEVGHVVETDFGTTSLYEEAIAAGGPHSERNKYWRQWASELFADVYAALCVGPAYLLGLVHALARPQNELNCEDIATAKEPQYPPHGLRVKFNVEVLCRFGFAGEDVAALWQEWRGAYQEQPTELLKPYYDDAPAIAELFCTTVLPVFGRKTVVDVISTSPSLWAEIRLKAAHLIQYAPNYQQPPSELLEQPSEQNPTLFRSWYAAAALAYHRKPERFLIPPAQKRYIELLEQMTPRVTRGPERKVSRSAAENAAAYADEAPSAVEARQAAALGELLAQEFGALLPGEALP